MNYELKKHCLDLTVRSAERLTPRHALLRLTADEPLPQMRPGQFVEVRVDNGAATFLRRPISINFFDPEANELWLLVAGVGEGTRHLCDLHPGDVVNCLLPLGRPFSSWSSEDAAAPRRVLLVGGGVGVAPLLFQGAELQRKGIAPHFLLGARTEADLLELDFFARYGEVSITTEDGSRGERGFVTNHSVLCDRQFDFVQTCGPSPMMRAVARWAQSAALPCEASLENMMACGLGACLCCVEKTRHGNLCVCKDGPVFNVEDLLW